MEIKRDRFRKTIVSPFTGQEYLIRKISLRDFLAEIGILPMAVSTTVAEQLANLSKEIKNRRDQDPDMEKKITEYVVRTSVITPKIWFGDEDKCPDDRIAYMDMGDDARVVSAAICEFSFEFTGLKDMEKFFRESGAVAAGSDGAEVRREAVEPSAEGNS